jgi:hypothetical protein
MNPKIKRILEIFIVIFILFNIIYFYIYKSWFLDDYCWKKSQDVLHFSKINLLLLNDCKTSYFCKVNNSKYKNWKLTKYECIKEKVDYYELNYYKSFINNVLQWK